MAIKKFESGKYYRWTGGKKRPEPWSSLGSMDFMLDGLPHKCLGQPELDFATFKVDMTPWYWGGRNLKYFELVPTKEAECLIAQSHKAKEPKKASITLDAVVIGENDGDLRVKCKGMKYSFWLGGRYKIAKTLGLKKVGDKLKVTFEVEK